MIVGPKSLHVQFDFRCIQSWEIRQTVQNYYSLFGYERALYGRIDDSSETYFVLKEKENSDAIETIMGAEDSESDTFLLSEKNSDISNDDEIKLKAYENRIELEKKKLEIEEFLKENDASTDRLYLNKLRSFALSRGGLVNDDIRRQVWPLLLELHPDGLEPYPAEVEFSHVEYSQVVLDVNRSIKRFPPAIPSDQRVSMQDQLIRLILRVITKHPQLQYYQGYHDVAITFLLVVGEVMAFHIMEKLSTNHLKHFMEPTMEKTAELLDYIFPLLDHLHPELCDYIEKAEVGSIFCLPWFLTWYSHTLGHYDNVVRLYDYFLASEPLIPLYLIPQIVIFRQDAIFEAECEMSSMHQQLSKLPEDLPFDDLLINATDLYNQHPPDEIEKESKIRRTRKLRKEYVVRVRNPKEDRHYWNFVNRMLPTWIFWPGRVGFFVFSAGFIAGVYVYYRYSNVYEVYNNQNIGTK